MRGIVIDDVNKRGAFDDLAHAHHVRHMVIVADRVQQKLGISSQISFGHLAPQLRETGVLSIGANAREVSSIKEEAALSIRG